MQTTLVSRHKVKTGRRFVFGNIMDLDHVCTAHKRWFGDVRIVAQRPDYVEYLRPPRAGGMTTSDGIEAMQLRSRREALGGFVVAGLVEDKFGGAPGAVGDEGDLGVDDFEKEIARAFGKYREGGLVGDLYG